jgi:hypothetical protein
MLRLGEVSKSDDRQIRPKLLIDKYQGNTMGRTMNQERHLDFSVWEGVTSLQEPYLDVIASEILDRIHCRPGFPNPACLNLQQRFERFKRWSLMVQAVQAWS